LPREETAVESIIGRRLMDRDGEAIGKITDVIYDATTLEPDWITVKMSRFGGEHLVPASVTESGAEGPAVPFPKEMVKEAPTVERGHVAPSATERRSIFEHYGMEPEAPGMERPA
jgi:sporulation protein YlmC with PRC-barrel domain